MAPASGEPDLPPAYAEALRLRAAGVDNDGIAAHLHVPPEAVRSMLLVANAKLARSAGAETQHRPSRGERDGE